jgi:SHS2 domain-containing protein
VDQKFQILPHIADIKIRAWGKNHQELFLNAMKGMMQILSFQIKKSERKAEKSGKRKITIESFDVNSLLIDFLNEVLYQAQVNREIYDEIKFLNFSEINLKAELFGHPITEFNKDIKAVTYHGKGIKKNPTGFETTILLDI